MSRPCAYLIVVCAFTTVSQLAASGADVTPRQCFQSFIGALYGAKDLSQVEQYFCPQMRTAYKTLPGAERIAKLKELKAYYIGNYKILDEKITGTNAVVTARGAAVNPTTKKLMSQTDVFDYIREGGYWRITGAKLSGVFRL